MSTPPPKMDALLQTATSLFSANGYHAVGVDRIKEASGVAKMTLYKYFPTKEVLIEQVLTRRDETMREALTAAMAAQATPVARIKAVFDWHLRWFGQPDFNGCMFIKAAEEFPDDASEIRHISRLHKLWIKDVLENLLREAKAKEPERLAGYLLVVLDGLIVNANLFKGVDQVSAAWDHVLPLLPKVSKGRAKG